MALTKQSVVDQITVIEDGQLQIRTVVRIFEDGELISQSIPHRHVVVPGQDVTNEDARVRQAVAAFHTPQVVADFLAARNV